MGISRGQGAGIRGRRKKKSLAGSRHSATATCCSVPDNRSVLRVVDANLNRAREGLRVLEDTARFVWGASSRGTSSRGTSSLFRKLRAMRHWLDKVTRSAYPLLLSSRESVGDMGRAMKESPSRPWRGLVIANFRRAQEALRVLEEYGKAFAPPAAAQFKAMRFGLYVLEKKTVEQFLVGSGGSGK